MAVTQNRVYVKWQYVGDNDIQNVLSGPSAESIFPSPNNNAHAVSVRRRFHDY